MKDLVHDARDGRRSIDDETALWNVFFRFVQARDEFTFHWLSAAPLMVQSLVKPPVQCAKVNLENEDAVEQSNKFGKIPGTTAEECDRFILVCD